MSNPFFDSFTPIVFWGGALDPPPAASFRAKYFSATTSTSYSFASSDIGTAHADRMVVVAVSTWIGAATQPTSVTVNGISATKAAGDGQAGGAGGSASIWYAAVPTGTSVTIVVNTASAVGCVIGVYAVYPASQTPTGTGTAKSASASTITVSNLNSKTAAGWTIMVGYCGVGGVSCTFSNSDTETTTETYDSLDITAHAGGAWMTNVNSNATDDFTYTTTGAGVIILATAAWF